METPRARVLNDDAVSQADRAAASPSPDRVCLDDGDRAQRLAFAADFGSLVNFYTLANEVDGDWSGFFSSDPTISLAKLAVQKIEEIDRQFDALFSELRSSLEREVRIDRLRRIVTKVLALLGVDVAGAESLDDAETLLRREVRRPRSDHISGSLRRLDLHLAALGLEESLRLDHDERARGWLDTLLTILEEVIDDALLALQSRVDRARSQLQQPLPIPGVASSKPPAALYIAFAELLGIAQESINRVPSRLVDFYYGTVLHDLKDDDQPPKPDQVYLTFAPAKGVQEFKISAGAVFPAGQSASGEPISFAADGDLKVNSAALSTLSVIRVAETTSATQQTAVAARVLVHALPLKGDPASLSPPLPLFGSTGGDTDLDMEAAQLGFAVAGPAFRLEGGARSVGLKIAFAPQSFLDAWPTLRAIGAAAGGFDAVEALRLILEGGLELFYSTAKGWKPTPHKALASGVAAEYELQFSLPPEADPVEPIPPGLAADGLPRSDQPCVVARVRQDEIAVGDKGGTKVAPYSILSRLILTTLSATVRVDDYAVFPAAPAIPGQIALFGATPVAGASMEISVPELFAKDVSILAVKIAWVDPPASSTGFAGYYRGYVVDADGGVRSSLNGETAPLFDNTVFRVSLEAVRSGRWGLSTTAGDPLYLFQTGPDTGAANPMPAPTSPINPVSLLKRQVVRASSPSVDQPSKGALRLTLTSPSYAFGAALYPNTLNWAAQAQAAAAAHCAQACAKQAPSTADASSKPDPLAQLSQALPSQGAAAKVNVQDLTAKIEQAVSTLVSQAECSAREAVARAKAPAETAAAQLASLDAAVKTPVAQPPQAGWFRRSGQTGTPASDKIASLKAWIETNRSALRGAASAPLIEASGALSAAEALAAAQTASPTAASVAPTVTRARATLAEAQAQSAQSCLAECMQRTWAGMPNPPWLPAASRISISYQASADLPGADLEFWRLLPTGESEKTAWAPGQSVSFLAPVDFQGALYLGLSAPAKSATLLFVLSPRAQGTTGAAVIPVWEQRSGALWEPIDLLTDGTNGLQRSGIVSLRLLSSETDPPQLRLRVDGDADAFPLLALIATNALTATRTSAAGVEAPVKAGIVTKSQAPLPGIGAIAQPAASFGGRPSAAGGSGRTWQAERLRHKGFAIDDLDYALLALSEFPSLWQVAVCPATDATGSPSPGAVWIVVVPGPGAAGVADPTTPYADATLLGAVKDSLQARASPFVRLFVTNPRYVGLTVTASVWVSDVGGATLERLADELKRWLSPWPDPTLGNRPRDYFVERRIAEFIRARPYVRGLQSISIQPDPSGDGLRREYLTSALSHRISLAPLGDAP